MPPSVSQVVELEVLVILDVVQAFMVDSLQVVSSPVGTEEQEMVVSNYCYCCKDRMVLVGILDVLHVVDVAAVAKAVFLDGATVEEDSVYEIVLVITMREIVDYETVVVEDPGSMESSISYLVAVQILKVHRTIEKLDHSLVAFEGLKDVVRMVMCTMLVALLLVRILL